MFGLDNRHLRDVEAELEKSALDDITQRDFKYWLEKLDDIASHTPMPDLEVHTRNLIALIKRKDKNALLHYIRQSVERQESFNRTRKRAA